MLELLPNTFHQLSESGLDVVSPEVLSTLAQSLLFQPTPLVHKPERILWCALLRVPRYVLRTVLSQILTQTVV